MIRDENDAKRSEYYRGAESWASEKERSGQKSHRAAWTIAAIASAIALCEAVAIAALVPLKTVVPYTLLVDRQTGYVEALKPLERQVIAPDRALTRSFLAQYVIAREGFDIETLRQDYRKVALWSAGEARTRYIASMQASNPASPLATLPRRALVGVQIRGISSLGRDTALVRFTTSRNDGGQSMVPQTWAAIVSYKFTNAEMTADDRLLNPLGFQVIRYRRDAETLPELPPSSEPGEHLAGSRVSAISLDARKVASPSLPSPANAGADTIQ